MNRVKTMRIKTAIVTLLVSSIILGCSMTTAVSFKQALSEPHANFHLYVSNQSFADPSIDIIAKIGERAVVAGQFKVKNQHHWEVYLPFICQKENMFSMQRPRTGPF